METLTNQTAFNRVVKHLLKQRVPARDNDRVCKYRDYDNGRKCAIGCLIPDAEYKKNMEGSSIFGLAEEGRLPSSLEELNLELLDELQTVHDYREPSTWLQQLGTIAVKYSLSMPNG